LKYLKDLKLDNLIKDKRVIIVGPSDYLVGQGRGEYIDSHDVVCRVNDVIPKNHELDFGSRTDIMFHSLSTRYLANLEKKLAENIDITKAIKLVYCTSVKADHSRTGNVIDNFNQINKYSLPVSFIGNTNYYWAEAEIGCEPNSGQAAILIMRQYNIKTLTVVGFSFYAQFSKDGYAACYYDFDAYAPAEKFPITSSPIIGHQQTPQIEHFKKTVLEDERILIDQYLKDLLNIDCDRIV